MDLEFDNLIFIRRKISRSEPLTSQDNALWQQWLNKPNVREYRKVKRSDVLERLHLQKTQLSWEEAKKKMGINS